MASRGMLHSWQLSAIIPRSCSISGSSRPPTLMCRETPSAPIRTASSTLPVRTLRLGERDRDVLAEKCTSTPGAGTSVSDFSMPLFIMTLVRPARAHSRIGMEMSSRPGRGAAGYAVIHGDAEHLAAPHYPGQAYLKTRHHGTWPPLPI